MTSIGLFSSANIPADIDTLSNSCPALNLVLYDMIFKILVKH